MLEYTPEAVVRLLSETILEPHNVRMQLSINQEGNSCDLDISQRADGIAQNKQNDIMNEMLSCFEATVDANLNLLNFIGTGLPADERNEILDSLLHEMKGVLDHSANSIKKANGFRLELVKPGATH